MTIDRCRALALFLLLLAAACDGKEQLRSPPYGEWSLVHSHGVPARTSGQAFDFPRCSDPIQRRGPSVHYVTRAPAAPLEGSVSLAFEITGEDPVFAATDGIGPRVSLHFQRRGDTMTAKGDYAGYRWWSRKSVPLAPGSFALSAPLVMDEWKPVLAHGIRAGLFDAARQAPAQVGFTFGGSGGLGHGVCLTAGTARFTVTEFTIN